LCAHLYVVAELDDLDPVLRVRGARERGRLRVDEHAVTVSTAAGGGAGPGVVAVLPGGVEGGGAVSTEGDAVDEPVAGLALGLVGADGAGVYHDAGVGWLGAWTT
jgi:hypothetical protein